MGEGVDVADNPGRRLEPVELLAGLDVDGLQVPLERAVEDDVAGGGEGTRPHRERLWNRPDDFAGARIPRDEVAEVVLSLRRIHRESRSDIGLPRRVRYLERLVVHADVVGRAMKKAGFRGEAA